MATGSALLEKGDEVLRQELAAVKEALRRSEALVEKLKEEK